MNRKQEEYVDWRLREIEMEKNEAIVLSCTSWPKWTTMTRASFARAVKSGKIKPIKKNNRFEVREGTPIGQIWDLSKIRLEKMKHVDNKQVERRREALELAMQAARDKIFLGDATAMAKVIEALSKTKF